MCNVEEVLTQARVFANSLNLSECILASDGNFFAVCGDIDAAVNLNLTYVLRVHRTYVAFVSVR